MGKRIDFDKAMSQARIDLNDSIYAKPNKFGFKININHPQIKPLYERYKKWCGEKILSDRQRLHFESVIFQLINRGGKNREQSSISGQANG